MKIEVEKFVKLPSLFLFVFPPCDNDCSNNSCLLTCKDYNEIKNAVCTDDGRIYDAHALKKWLKTQEDEKFVIPGVLIHTVKVYTWRNFKLHVDLYKKTLMFINFTLIYVNIFKKNIYLIYTLLSTYQSTQLYFPETSDSATQTDTWNDNCVHYNIDKSDCYTNIHNDIDELTCKFRNMKIKKKVNIPSRNSAFIPYTHICF